MCLQQVTALTRHKADPKHRDHWISKALEIFSFLPVYITLTPESKGTKQPVSKLCLMAGNSGKRWDLNLRKATISNFILNVVKYYINSRILPMMNKQIIPFFGFWVIWSVSQGTLQEARWATCNTLLDLVRDSEYYSRFSKPISEVVHKPTIIIMVLQHFSVHKDTHCFLFKSINVHAFLF